MGGRRRGSDGGKDRPPARRQRRRPRPQWVSERDTHNGLNPAEAEAEVRARVGRGRERVRLRRGGHERLAVENRDDTSHAAVRARSHAAGHAHDGLAAVPAAEAAVTVSHFEAESCEETICGCKM